MPFSFYRYVDRLGRKPLLLWGTFGMTVSLFACTIAFYNVSYQFDSNSFGILRSEKVPEELIGQLQRLGPLSAGNEDDFFASLLSQLQGVKELPLYRGAVVRAAISLNAPVVLVAVIGYVASFAVSLGPVMWVLLAEIFPNTSRGKAMSIVGFWNSIVSASVTLLFPWELSYLRAAGTFLCYALLSLAALVFVLVAIPETKGQSLEELEALLVRQEWDESEVCCFSTPSRASLSNCKRQQ